MAHYAQAGGDVAAAVRTHHSRLAVLHAKDVRTVPRAADARPNAPAYQFVELGGAGSTCRARSARSPKSVIVAG